MFYNGNASAIKLSRTRSFTKGRNTLSCEKIYMKDDDIGIEQINGRKQLAYLLTKPAIVW